MRKSYRNIKDPLHPFADSKGWVREHRKVYEDYYKCILLPWVDIHHKDGDSLNNNISNLEPHTHGQHVTIEKFGTPRVEEIRKKLSESKKGNKNPMFGKKRPDEIRERISKALKGIPKTEEHRRKISENWTYRISMLGKHHNKETKIKMSETKKGHTVSENTRKKISETLKARNK